MVSLTPQQLILTALPLSEGIEEIGGANRGRAVERILKSTGNAPGDPWCASFVYSVGSQLLGKGWKLPRTASCDALLQFARKKKVLRDKPEVGAVFLLMKTYTDAIHTGFVTEVHPDGSFSTFEGNTNPDGGREGYGVFRRRRGVTAKNHKFIVWWNL